MRVTAWRWLFDELDPLHQVAGRPRVGSSIAGGDNHACLLDGRGEYLFQQNPEDWFLNPVAVDQHLQRQRPLVNTGGGDDGFANIHGVSRGGGGLPIVARFAAHDRGFHSYEVRFYQAAGRPVPLAERQAKRLP